MLALISLSFASQAIGVLRPLFPIKPAAPSNGELIVIGDELALQSAQKPNASPRPGPVATFGRLDDGDESLR